MDFYEGQVVLYGDGAPHQYECVVLNTDRGCSKDAVKYRKIAWRTVKDPKGRWIVGHGAKNSTWKPHPDPDPVWADYCASVLAGEIDTTHEED